MKWSQQLKLLKGFSYFIFMYTNVFLSLHINTWYFWKPKEGARSFGSWVTLCRCWDQTFILYESSKCSYSLSHVSVPPNSNFHSQIVYYNTIQRHINVMFTWGKLTVKKILSSYFKEKKTLHRLKILHIFTFNSLESEPRCFRQHWLSLHTPDKVCGLCV